MSTTATASADCVPVPPLDVEGKQEAAVITPEVIEVRRRLQQDP